MTDPTPTVSPAPRLRTAGSLHRHGGLLCLDFVNTATWASDRVLREHLIDTEDVRQWGAYCELAVPAPCRQPGAQRGAATSDDDLGLEAVRLLRAALRRLFTTPTGRHEGGQWQRDMTTLGDNLCAAMARAKLAGPTLPLTWQSTADVTAWLFGPVAVCAAALLTSPAILRVRQCEGEGCGWLFLDQSRSHRRRWCAMEPCGNKVKARAHAGRRRGQGAVRRGRPE